jgi:signal transduction histidine kinase
MRQAEEEHKQIEFMNSLLRFASHDMKTPANAIIHSMELCELEGDISDSCANYIRIGLISAKQLLYLIHNLLDYGSIM